MDQNGYSSNLSSLNSSSSFSDESDETSSFSDESDQTSSFSDESDQTSSFSDESDEIVDQLQQEIPNENHVQETSNPRPTAVSNRTIRVITVEDTMRLVAELRRSRNSVTTGQPSDFSWRFQSSQPQGPQLSVQPPNMLAPMVPPPSTQRPQELTFRGLVGSTVGPTSYISTVGGGVTAPLVSPTNSLLPQSGNGSFLAPDIFNRPYQAPNSVANRPSQANNHPPPQAAPNQRPTAVGNRTIRFITVQDTMRLLEELRRPRSSITPPTSQSSYFSSRFHSPQGFVQPTNTVAPVMEFPPYTQGPQEFAFPGRVGSSSTMGPTSYFPTVGGGVTASLVPPAYSSLPQTVPNIFNGPYQTPNSVGNGPSQANNHPPPPAAPNQRSIPNRVYDPMHEEMGLPNIQTPTPPNNEGNN